MTATDWLRENAPGFSNLSPTELAAISDFALLVSLFEARLLDRNGGTQAICDLVDGWSPEMQQFDDQRLTSEFEYFKARYFMEGVATEHLAHLHLPKNDLGRLALDVLKGTVDDHRNRLVACLMVVFRYRHNLFHGEKWTYKLSGQLENFSNANAVLMKLLEAHNGVSEA